ncbi:type II secretion system F family protein [Pseudomonas sp. M30-35]|uniref:type II secretion system F family protein n=1 Tax=Pseudomonas sp. M30-35 TaxID=1981174 RepID=UPI000B3C63F6|nr:type II secretion system F family protein [Pseudomonas sp. M30-35]ARU89908.1 type II secretion system protein F [Pseudomonas sp. M30-35]
MAWAVMVLLLSMAAALLIANALQQQRVRALVAKRLVGGREQPQHKGRRGDALIQQLGRSVLGRKLLSLDGETHVLLNRIGWRRANQRALYMACQLLLPFLMLGLVVLVISFLAEPPEKVWVFWILALGCGFLLPKRVLSMAAARRQQQLVNEVSIFIPLLRILFDAGLTVEQSLRVISLESKKLLPVLTTELDAVLKHVDSGLELADELSIMGKQLDVDELSDSLAILQQLIRQGGGAMSSLLALKKLLDERRLTNLQEYISKLSGKMSVVMMLFLFPALLIVLAGPGMSAIGRALGGIS